VQPTHYVDISATLQTKARAALHLMRCRLPLYALPLHALYVCVVCCIAQINAWLQHKTQYPSAAAVTEMLTLLAQRMANNTRLPNVSYAEGFRAFF
jgi:hypothetical protein